MHATARTRFAILAFVLVLSALTASASDDSRMRVGHDPAWASPSFDDTAWTRMHINEIPHPGDSVWMRKTIDVPHRPPGVPLGLYYGGLGSHEIWWDGVRVGGGGVVGRSAAEEKPGPVEAHYQIPDRLAAPGKHTLALRLSAFHRGFEPRTGYWAVIVGNYDQILEIRNWSARVAMIALSGILLTTVFALAMYWLTGRERSFLLLGVLCLSSGALLLAEAWRSLFGYTYDWHIVRLRSIVALSWLTGVLLVALIVTRFPHRRGRLVIAATVVVASIIPFIPRGWDPKSIFIHVWCFPVATLWCGWAAWRRLHGSALALIGVAVPTIVLFARPWEWFDRQLYFALNFLFICLLCSHALEVRRVQQEKSEALLRSARLELEMVKRHLQPHFLMNTLTALSEWIEEDPRTAVRMIDSLAEELRILSDASSRKLIPADVEIRLCRAHLETMSLRRDSTYDLSTSGFEGDELVPPAVFHTLIENAVTHSGGRRDLRLRLSASRDGNQRRYVFQSPVADDAEQEARVGTGTRYIEARLREAWGDAGSFAQRRVGDFWHAEIVTPHGVSA